SPACSAGRGCRDSRWGPTTRRARRGRTGTWTSGGWAGRSRRTWTGTRRASPWRRRRTCGSGRTRRPGRTGSRRRGRRIPARGVSSPPMPAPPPDLLDDLRRRGLLHQTTGDEALRAHLADPDKAPRRGYAGFDPTADSLTIGNLVPIVLLRHLQLAGHVPVV